MTVAQGDPANRGIRVPPIPSGIAMTDRGTGTVWLLTWSDEAQDSDTLHFTPKMRFAATDDIPREIALKTYGPYEGPYLWRGGKFPPLRLFFRDSRLGYEVADSIVANGGVFGRVRLNRTVLAVILPDSWTRPTDAVAWEEIAL